jgi:hypothetical protein
MIDIETQGEEKRGVLREVTKGRRYVMTLLTSLEEETEKKW